MAFKIAVLSDSTPFFNAVEQAFEPLPFSVIRIVLNPCLAAEQEFDSAVFAGLKLAEISLIITGFWAHWVDPHNLACVQLAELTAEMCRQHKIPQIALSSYAVLGHQAGDWTETLPPAPDSPLGLAWLAAEQAWLTSPPTLILRMPWWYSPYSEYPEAGLLHLLCRRLLGSEPVDVSETAMGNIISWAELARYLAAMAQQILCGANNWGVFHVHASDSCSEAELADSLARLLRHEGFAPNTLSVIKGPACIVPGAAPLVGRRCTDNFGIQPRSFRLGLKSHVQRWLQEQGLLGTQP
jgi:dTDP-4-dehydrorhamnose reductase